MMKDKKMDEYRKAFNEGGAVESAEDMNVADNETTEAAPEGIAETPAVAVVIAEGAPAGEMPADAEDKAEMSPEDVQLTRRLRAAGESLGVPLADHLVLLHEGRMVASGPLGETLARADLPPAFADDAGVVIETVLACHEADALSRLDFAGASLRVGQRAEGGRRKPAVPGLELDQDLQQLQRIAPVPFEDVFEFCCRHDGLPVFACTAARLSRGPGGARHGNGAAP